ncbi:FecR family protein [Paraflavitalea pollutisoli]|uniref:FecR family protein n=1 Tax=Paraflavitalea pollutisoli TaxID=3034143 RepID=UPI0023EB3D89|nr:FecR family protein [Paraflavitalea sp. H1-2-19X]
MNRLEILWKGYQQGLLSPTELAELLQLLQQENSPLAGMIDALLQQETTGTTPPGEKEAILERLRRQLPATDLPAPSRIHWLRRYRWVAAATFLLLSGSMLWFSIDNNNKAITEKGQASAPVTDAAPGKNGAVLTLSDGSTIVLDSLGNGAISSQGNSQLVLADGALSYHPGKSAAQQARMEMNTITTPLGRQFRVVLSDGTKVWLNAGSSLTYPVSFTGEKRVVSITGEAYFEASKATQPNGQRMPFVVEVNSTIVEVLGTHFNINAYEAEGSIATTLLEGKVKVSYSDYVGPADQQAPPASVILRPGQQALTQNSSLAYVNTTPPIYAEQVNIEQVIAWKNGYFNFHKTGLPQVIGQLARWYGVRVEVRGEYPDRLFGGEIERSLQLSQVIKILERMGVHCTIENGILVVHGTTKR